MKMGIQFLYLVPRSLLKTCRDKLRGACPVLDTGDDVWIPAGVYPVL